MALIDPPEYVALPSPLVYGEHDLAPEYRLRLEQILGWMWVTRKTRAPLGAHVDELTARWGIAPRTVQHTLQVLADGGYLEIDYNRRGWVYIQQGPTLTNPHRPREAAESHTDRPREAANTTHTDRPREAATTERATPLRARATPLRETAESGDFRATPLRGPNTNSTVVVVDPVSDQPDHDPGQQQLHTITTDRRERDECMARLEAARVWPDVAAQLAADPWVTAARVDGWHAYLEDKKARGETIGGRAIGNVAALLTTNLRAHREPPAAQPAEEAAGWRRFVQGEYAEYCA